MWAIGGDLWGDSLRLGERNAGNKLCEKGLIMAMFVLWFGELARDLGEIARTRQRPKMAMFENSPK
jgi:hypothetical protein